MSTYRVTASYAKLLFVEDETLKDPSNWVKLFVYFDRLLVRNQYSSESYDLFSFLGRVFLVDISSTSFVNRFC